MHPDGIIRRRHLPHWDVDGKPFFVTACLDGSIAAAGMKRIQEYRLELDARPRPEQLSEHEWERNKDKLLFAVVDDLLDHQSPVRYLADDRQAEIVQNAFLHFAGERYTLLAFVVMPSHHHWLFLPDENWSRQAVEQSRQSTSGPLNKGDWLRANRAKPGKVDRSEVPVPLVQRAARPRTPREIISHSIQSFTATMCNRVRGESGSYWQPETFDHWARDEAEMYRIIDYIERNPVKAGLAECPEDWRWSSARLRTNAGTKLGDPIPNPVG